MRILLVDDDEILIDVLQKTLAEKNYTFDAVFDGEQGWTYGSSYNYDLVILDWSLPKLDGISLCKRFRTHGFQMPILLLTARDSNQEKIMGLDAGADDYLCKPFNIEELGARIRALLRRPQSNLSPILSWGDLRLDTRNCQVVYQETSIWLTSKEYQLLELFLTHPQFVFSINDIIDNLWSSVEYPSEATVRSHLRHLRQKLKKAGVKNNPIETLRGRGYCLKYLSPNSPSESKLSSLPKNESPQLLERISDKQKRHLDALSKAWQKYQPKIIQQLTVLQNTLHIWQKNYLTEIKRQEAVAVAHKLAGTVGVFGFDESSRLASKLEHLLQDRVNDKKRQILQFETILNLLHQQLTAENDLVNPIANTIDERHFLLLIIDNDRQFIDRLNAEATARNIQTQSITTVKLARDWLQGLEHKRLPNVILLRISYSQSSQLNTESSEEHLSLIKNLHELFPSIPIIVIADRDRFEDRLLLAKNGVTFYLKQPITATEAIVYCQQAVQNACQEKKVMIVDDDRELLKLLSSSLESCGLQVTTLDDPRQFWDVFEAITPDLLILDIEMPYLSGIELCQVLRTNPRWYKLPVLYFSIHEHRRVQNQLCISHADELVHKSVGGKQLASRIAYHLQKQQNLLTFDFCPIT